MSLCTFETTGTTDDGRLALRCTVCGRVVRWKDSKIKAHCGPIVERPPAGPGTELRRIFAELSIKATKGCKCKAFAAKMDSWGVDGCRERREEIASELQAKSKEFGLDAFLTAAWRSIASGIALRLNPICPLLSLVDLAIAQAQRLHPHGPQTNPPPASHV